MLIFLIDKVYTLPKTDTTTTTNNQQPTTNNQQPTTNNYIPTTNNQQPTTNHHQPANQQPTTNIIHVSLSFFLGGPQFLLPQVVCPLTEELQYHLCTGWGFEIVDRNAKHGSLVVPRFFPPLCEYWDILGW